MAAAAAAAAAAQHCLSFDNCGRKGQQEQLSHPAHWMLLLHPLLLLLLQVLLLLKPLHLVP
jgi:hypothetical protein